MLEANPERRESRGKAKNFDKIESVFLLHLANVKELNKELGNSCDASFPAQNLGANFSHDKQNYSPKLYYMYFHSLDSKGRSLGRSTF